MLTTSSQKILGYIALGVSSLTVVMASQIPQAYAASMTFSATGTNSATSSSLESSVIFNDSLNPGKLTITLTNLGAGAKAPSDVLTSLFWDYNGSSPLNLSLASATAATVTQKNTNTTTSNVNLLNTPNGKEWAFASTTKASGLGGDVSAAGAVAVTQQYGLGTAGLGIFQGIGGSSQQKYGIINGYGSGANNPIKTNPFVNNSATFVLSGLTAGFDIKKISNIRFQYGTNLNEAATYYVAPPPPPQKVPEPSAAVALGLFAIGGVRVVKKKSLLAV
ncbi:XDD4 family exosortase-dependent surface protein [Anabaena lutea]|uniref:PEP-CTERM sorting domain-containing protein n=1 Tax=Anabaena lutea FACHB-196 TaxID=2692881 RepID=A0ABR8FC28_9NOST|nr:XDD4 family exosortase-dependent surface protein [Anabaena lutea]MBD2567661.1 PEP-CTERM sorting domain-containing protein [Anabaena lutea FACHB-196]